MRYGLLTLSLLSMILATVLGMSAGSSPAHADPYLWCAVYGPNGNQSCFFKTLDQCRTATLAGGACSPNPGYDRDSGNLGRRHHALRY